MSAVAWRGGIPWSRAAHVRDYLALLKPRVVLLVLFTAAVACVDAARGAPSGAVIAGLLISGALSAGGVAALNHYVDRDIDGRMARTRRRPLVAGRIERPGLVLAGGVGLTAAGLALAAWVSPLLASFELVGAFTYGVVYTMWLKRRTSLNVVVGGAAGSAAVLGGWAAAQPSLGLAPWLLAAVVFLWTPAHFWSLALARTDDYARAGVPMLSVVAGPRTTARWVVVHILGSLAATAWFGVVDGRGPIYLATASVAGLWFLAVGLRVLRRPDAAASWRAFKVSGAYLGLVFLGLLVDVLTMG
ncbi:MAG: protoheme IX farnesyltransferase [Chloroflexi bacterium]|nr:protoheme IX farnesyltransferase [Chloroflexota bacterium]